MRSRHLIPIAVLAFAVACTENTPTPAEINVPQFAPGNPGNPQYQFSNYSVTNTTNTSGFVTASELKNDFKETGLGSFSSVRYELTARFNATAQCFNSATKQVSGQPFNFTATPSDTETVPIHNGQVTATRRLGIGPASCPNSSSARFTLAFSNAYWDQIKFCWGGQTATTNPLFQGPVPQTNGDGTFRMDDDPATTTIPATQLSADGVVNPLGPSTAGFGILAGSCTAGQAL